MSSTLILAGTPIGDTASVSPALLDALASAKIIVAEDTRRAIRLFERLGVKTAARLISCFDGNEEERIPELIELLTEGCDVIFITDAGMPVISDPGYRLVRAAIAADIRVTALPGPSAVLTALAVSGMPADRFCFEGFLSRKSGQRRRQLADLSDEVRTMIFFEAPHRLADFLSDAADIFGANRQAAICRELTKTYEEVKRGDLAELACWAEENARGEITVVIHGGAPAEVNIDDALEIVAAKTEDGQKLSQAVSETARELGIRRKDLYQAALANR